MTEQHSNEVEKVLLYITDARARARKASETVQKSGADPHVVKALQDTADQLAALDRTLRQSTYYAVADDTLRMVL